ncbi:MAG: signal peptidase II [Coxiellaceae bacterium]|jgi:signal peptidase II|nr:signal peptidase II [Coxiellaceae bacterium]
MAIFKKYLWVIIVILAFVVDRLTKTLVLNNFTLGEVVNIMPFFNLYFTFNLGAAFSFLNQAQGWQEWLFGAIAVVVSFFLIVWQLKIPVKDLWLKISLALILGGTLGNLYDRIFYHMVIDFIDFYVKDWHYPTFNLADTAICVGAIMLAIDIVWKDKNIKV